MIIKNRDRLISHGDREGRELALEMLSEAGLTEVEILESSNPTNAIYVCHKA